MVPEESVVRNGEQDDCTRQCMGMDRAELSREEADELQDALVKLENDLAALGKSYGRGGRPASQLVFLLT